MEGNQSVVLIFFAENARTLVIWLHLAIQFGDVLINCCHLNETSLHQTTQWSLKLGHWHFDISLRTRLIISILLNPRYTFQRRLLI